MSEKIEIGEYVRTREGFIGELVEINKKNWNYLTIDCKRKVRTDGLYPDNYIYLKDGNIVKHSKNIIELIEEKDILKYKMNGLEREYITVVKKYHDNRTNENWLLINGYKLEQIEVLEILTHEQFDINKYKIGGVKDGKFN